jgi:hypothetical protein
MTFLPEVLWYGYSPQLPLDKAAISHDLGGQRAAEQCFFQLWTTFLPLWTRGQSDRRPAG